MPYKFLPDVALADVAFEASSSSLDGLFEEAAKAMTEVMVDSRSLSEKVTRVFSVESQDADRLLYDFLSELIVAKDVDSLLFKRFEVSIGSDRKRLKCKAHGETIDRERHRLRNDVKAVTLHLFGIRRDRARFLATVVLDI
ncbi:MAG TPA: archease [Nitrososphaerales archaeon]|nr:archease [Nitrososphaerales archaeon]